MKTSNFVDKNAPTIKPVYNPTLTEIMRYIDNMVEEEWQEFVGLLEARGWTLDTIPKWNEWCTDCKEYDQQKHCCPRWNRVIRKTLKEWEAEIEIEELPPAQPKIIHCGDCRYWKNNHLCECLSKYGTFETKIYFYCGFAERREE